MQDRRIMLSGAFNFRELGTIVTASGAQVRTGRAYRADALHRLTAEDSVVLRELGIERVYDLRSEAELENDGLGQFAGNQAVHFHVPLVSITLSPFDPSIDWAGMDLQSRYIEMLEGGGEPLLTVLSALAEPNAPALVYHCTGGKDRTGVVTAVLLRILGVDDEVIVEDYARSEKYLRPVVEQYRETLQEQRVDDDAIAYLTSSTPERMRRTLATLDERWGDIDGYLAHIGAPSGLCDALRANLLA